MSMDLSNGTTPSLSINKLNDTSLNSNWITEKGAALVGAPPALVKRLIEIHKPDRIFHWFLRSVGFAVFLLLISIGLFLTKSSLPAIKAFGFGFMATHTWDPVRQIFGAMPVIYGTLVSSFLALIIATPVSLGIALFLNELAPRKIGTVVRFLVEMLAAIPSVVYGLWGIFVLAPWLRNSFQPAAGEFVSKLPFSSVIAPFVGGPYYGVGMFAAGIILAIMITPTISSISREVFSAIPRSQREAALAIGATRWEMMKLSVLKASRAGIMGAVVLGLGRALGETMAVTMVIGNRSEIAASIFAPAQTMASVIANEYAEANEPLHLAALAQVGLTLFAVTFVVNAIARFLVWRVTMVPNGDKK